MKRRLMQTWVVAVALALSLTAAAQSTPAPEITAQGFEMSTPQKGWLGKFGRLRVRFEAPERIAALVIKERSYEVDLASTLEPHNLALFGTQTRVRNHRDITLDFENYINTKLESEGQYYFSLTLTDKEGQSANATLSVIVDREKTSREIMEERLDRIDRGVFSFRRVGPGPVVGAGDFGITWKTIEDANVTIRIMKSEPGASKLLRLPQPEFDSVMSKAQLASRAAKTDSAATIEIPTTGNRAAGETFAVVIRDETYLFKIKESRTMLSELGTTVILNGEFKH
jgi:hypothetical protein